MQYIEIRKKGLLFRYVYGLEDPECISSRAIEFLFEPCKLEDGVTLRDVYTLVQHNPDLFQVFRRYGALELVEESLSGQKDQKESGKSPDDVEYLELFKIVDGPWKNSFELWPRLHLSGVGYPFNEDTVWNGCNQTKGSRISFTLMGCSPRDFLDFSVRLDDNSFIWRPKKMNGDPLESPVGFEHLDLGLPTLGEIVQGLFYDFSFFGVGKSREEFAKKLVNETDWQPLEDDLI